MDFREQFIDKLNDALLVLENEQPNNILFANKERTNNRGRDLSKTS